MHRYNLGFIADDEIFEIVKSTVLKYRTGISLAQFNKNIVDPIKLTFDSKVYQKSIKEAIMDECIRQLDKSNANATGAFHQYLFSYAKDDWQIPNKGFDLINDREHIYCEIKNKHNTMNAASSQKTYIQMQDKLLDDDKATCYLVEVIAKQSQNIPWSIKLNGKSYSHKRIRRISMDRFYYIVFNDEKAFYKLCVALPLIIDDVIEEGGGATTISNTVFEELEEAYSKDILKSLYTMAFKTYEGFNE
ncbi:MAG: Eco47II family restriction endonuclease [Porphyromonas sp.]|nr:Eco47II family restriction endonuclease [Porphyromonas sp.]